jgi:hypothetical protein
MNATQTSYQSHKQKAGITAWFRDASPKKILGSMVLMFVGLLVAYLTSEIHIAMGMGLAGLLIAVFLLLICVIKYEIGYYILFISSTFLTMPERIFGLIFPTGLITELLTYLVLIGLLSSKYRKHERVEIAWKDPLTILLLIGMVYYLIQVANPVRHSFLGWSMYFRKQISFLVFFYITWDIVRTFRKIHYLIVAWVWLSVIIALYSFKQHFWGFSDFEIRWLYANPDRPALYFQGGYMRKFSFLSDPSIFALTMASSGLMILVFGIRHKNPITSFWLVTAGVIVLGSTFFSGTRTANLIIAAGIFSYIVFTLNEFKSLAVAVVFGAITVVILYGPFNNVLVQRVRSTTEGKKDPSQMVREATRHTVQPYIYAHPIGGGINTCGIEGKLYNPGHYLSRLSPDSGYMKIMMEQGWVGLLLHVLTLFTAVKAGLDGFFTCKKDAIRTIYIALTVFLMGMCIGQISQIAIWGYPYILLIFCIFAIFQKLKHYDGAAYPNAYE